MPEERSSLLRRRPVVRVRLDPGASLPGYQTRGASGMDIGALEPATIPALGRGCVRTGVYLQLPRGWEVQVRPRSGLALRHGVGILNAPGTIDADYRGEVLVVLFNLGRKPFQVRAGDRVAQLVFSPSSQATLVPVPRLSVTRRGAGGFGHTGRGRARRR